MTNKQEQYIDDHFDDRMAEILKVFNQLPDWFDDAVDWDKVEDRLVDELIEEYENDKADDEIAAWEDNLAFRDEYNY